jgi:pimeloyl-ACP methyl ester carboxylesterase
MPTYSNAGLQLHFEELGTGPTLVLLHGFGQHGGAWEETLDVYRRYFRVLVPDMRGCGRSEAATPGFSIRDLAADLVALLDHLQIERAHFAGWSLGGAVGLELALGWPDRLKTLSLHSTFAGGRAEYQRNWITMRKKIILSGDKELDMATRIIGFFSPEFVNEHPERIDAFKRRELANPYPGSEAGLAGQNAAAQQHEARDRLGLIKMPTLITVGSADRTTLPAASRLMHQEIAGSELVIFDNAGHFPAFQVRDEFLSVSLGFLLKHEAVSPRAAA